MISHEQLDMLATAVRAAVAKRGGWWETARLVASELERHLPSPSILTAEQRAGDPETFRRHVLHSEPDGSFSIVALVWRPGQMTRIHDHVTWGAFAVIDDVRCIRAMGHDRRGVDERRLFLPFEPLARQRLALVLGHNPGLAAGQVGQRKVGRVAAVRVLLEERQVGRCA